MSRDAHITDPHPVLFTIPPPAPHSALAPHYQHPDTYRCKDTLSNRNERFFLSPFSQLCSHSPYPTLTHLFLLGCQNVLFSLSKTKASSLQLPVFSTLLPIATGSQDSCAQTVLSHRAHGIFPRSRVTGRSSIYITDGKT